MPDGTVSPHTVTAAAYGAFLCAVFDEWGRQDVGTITVQIFEEAARPARRLDHSVCIFRKTCGDNYLCAGYKTFFNHCLPYVLEVASPGIPCPLPARLNRPTSTLASRNDPCPCGSGRKYKKCCLAR